MKAVRCQQCGGAIAARADRPVPRCLFCGSDAVVPFDPSEDIEPPEGFLPFAVDTGTAAGAFADFATSSFWYPNDLQSARLELAPLLLPAWAWTGRIETHWTALRSAGTRSGKEPMAGTETVKFSQVLIPSSQSLTVAELRKLGEYDESHLADWVAASAPAPYEVSELTRSSARQAALREMERRHAAAIRHGHRALSVNTSCIALELDGRPVLVPVYIGAYPYGDKVYRVLVNGQTGHLIGEAPISWRKVVAVAALVLFVIAGLVLAFSLVSMAFA